MSEQEPTSKPPSQQRVGYGNPPLHSRWRPGQSGNPSGRPKGRRSFTTAFSSFSMRKVTATLAKRASSY